MAKRQRIEDSCDLGHDSSRSSAARIAASRRRPRDIFDDSEPKGYQRKAQPPQTYADLQRRGAGAVSLTEDAVEPNVPFPATLPSTAVKEAPDDYYDYDHNGNDAEADTAVAEGGRPRRRSEGNLRKHAAWAESYQEFGTHSYSSKGTAEPGKADRLRARLEDDFRSRVARCLATQCPQCCSQGAAPSSKARMVSFVTLEGSVDVMCPHFYCRHCKLERHIHPLQMGCFPSSPVSPGAWYDCGLMSFVRLMRAGSPYAASAAANIFKQQHSANGLPTRQAFLDAICDSALHWERVEKSTRGASWLGLGNSLPPGAAGTWTDCPCCWKHCVALSGDACMGLRRFGAAASSSMQLQPLSSSRQLFVAEEVARVRLAERNKLPADMEEGACSDFKASAIFGCRSAHYDRMGIAAFVCRHGFVVSMVSLQTPENFTYYELMLEAMNSKLNLAEVDAVFMDVACNFEKFYKRVCMSELGLPDICWAIGPWHIRPHKLECNVRWGEQPAK